MALSIAFVVMPFGTKPTGLRRAGVPSQVDFDAVWDQVYQPVLAEMGYSPVRADRDIGALIINQMVQRLALADLIVADVTLPNANVYYEIGVRHAARARGCVLTSAEWARPVFDLAQMRQVRYPLPDGQLTGPAAEAAGRTLRRELGDLVHGLSPVFEAVPGYPAKVDPRSVSAFEGFVAAVSEFQAKSRAARALPPPERPARVQALVEEYGRDSTILESVALELLLLLRDCVGWTEAAAYAETLPEVIRRHPAVREQQYLAMAQGGDTDAADAAAVGLLEQLIADEGESSERRGMLGGRYKRLLDRARTAADRRRYLDKAIANYELGMMADLNAYYPSSNLPRMYRARRDEGDEQKAALAAAVALAACRRALARGTYDEWLRATLLGAAFDAGDVAEARRILPLIPEADPADWQLKSTIADLRLSVSQQVDPSVAADLGQVLAQLEVLVR